MRKAHHPIQKCSKLLETACEEGLLDHIQFTEKSRGGEASSPVMQFGWTQTDCNQYSENRINSVGSIEPFICSNDCNNLSAKCKSALIECIDTTLRPAQRPMKPSALATTKPVELIMNASTCHLTSNTEDSALRTTRTRRRGSIRNHRAKSESLVKPLPSSFPLYFLLVEML